MTVVQEIPKVAGILGMSDDALLQEILAALVHCIILAAFHIMVAGEHKVYREVGG